MCSYSSKNTYIMTGNIKHIYTDIRYLSQMSSLYRLKKEPTRQSSAPKRTKKCCNCNKLIAVSQYQLHFNNCFRYREQSSTKGHSKNELGTQNNSTNRNRSLFAIKKMSTPINGDKIGKNKPGELIRVKNVHQKNEMKTIQKDMGKPKRDNGKVNNILKNSLISSDVRRMNGSKCEQQSRAMELKQQSENPESKIQRKQVRPQSRRNNFIRVRTPKREESQQLRYVQQQNTMFNNYNNRNHQQIANRSNINQITVHSDQSSQYESEQLLFEEQHREEESQSIFVDRQGTYLTVQELQRERIKRQHQNEIRRQRQIEYNKQREKQRVRERELELERQREQERESNRQMERERVMQAEVERARIRQAERQARAHRQRELTQQRLRQQRQRSERFNQQRQPQYSQQHNGVQNSTRAQLQAENIVHFFSVPENGPNSQQRVQQIILNTTRIIEFIEALNWQNQVLQVMLGQLRHLNLISSQIHQLNYLGSNLGFRMGSIFIERIQYLQEAIIVQLEDIVINNLHGQIIQDFNALLTQRPQIIQISHGFTKHQIQTGFALKLTLSQNQCSICLQDINKGQHIKQLQCRHIFHPECIDRWLTNSRKCPMCRTQQQLQPNNN